MSDMSLRSPEENPWYLLATLHGTPQQISTSDPVRHQNRIAWNRWMAVAIDEAEREKLIATGRYSRAELTPLSENERLEWQKLFKARVANQSCSEPPPPRREISISKVDFGPDFELSGYVFPTHLQAKESSFAAIEPFSDCDFLGISDFSKSRFSGPMISMRNNRFHNRAEFRSAEFRGPTSFLKTEFDGVDFREVAFQDHVDFFFLISSDHADFSCATFKHAAIFDNAEFKRPLSFRKAQFARPPLFLNSKLPDGLDFGEIAWPRLRAATKDPQEFIQAYQRLKFEMDRQKLHEQEMMFFGCEMQSRGAALGRNTLDGLAIATYGALSDYGRSYVRPLGWLALLIIVGGAIGFAVTGRSLLVSLGQSFVDSFGVFGFRKDFVDAFSLPTQSLRVVGWIQTIVGSALIFLFLLALQKRFRMR
jgi:hypothetical protein